MGYYKLINGTNFVGTASQPDFRMFQRKHNILLTCDEEEAQYIQIGDNLYRAMWMVPVTNDAIPYILVDVIRIGEDEFNALSNGEEFPAANAEGQDVLPEIEEQIAPNDADIATLGYIKNKKISEMSAVCNRIISEGFSLALSDGADHHFALTTQDQLNLITLATLVSNGEQAIPYHADGELCKFYSADDVRKIISAATAFKTYHISYFNTIKSYIASLDAMSDVIAVYYGMEIPTEYQSDVLKYLLEQIRNENNSELSN